jgi:excisionase family DNA binding protein
MRLILLGGQLKSAAKICINPIEHVDKRSDRHPSTLFDRGIWRIQDVADLMGCSVKHIYNLTSRNEIPHIKKGKFLFFIPKDILNWIQEGNIDD